MHSRLGRTALTTLDRRGIFANLDDTETALRDLLLHATFGNVALAPVGAVVIFTARQPHRQEPSA